MESGPYTFSNDALDVLALASKTTHNFVDVLLSLTPHALGGSRSLWWWSVIVVVLVEHVQDRYTPGSPLGMAPMFLSSSKLFRWIDIVAGPDSCSRPRLACLVSSARTSACIRKEHMSFIVMSLNLILFWCEGSFHGWRFFCLPELG